MQEYQISNEYIIRLERENVSCDVTRYELLLGSRDPTTGHRNKDYSTSTIKVAVIEKASYVEAVKAGVSVHLDAKGVTSATVNVGDKIETANGLFYEVASVVDRHVGDVTVARDCDLTELPLSD